MRAACVLRPREAGAGPSSPCLLAGAWLGNICALLLLPAPPCSYEKLVQIMERFDLDQTGAARCSIPGLGVALAGDGHCLGRPSAGARCRSVCHEAAPVPPLLLPLLCLCRRDQLPRVPAHVPPRAAGPGCECRLLLGLLVACIFAWSRKLRDLDASGGCCWGCVHACTFVCQPSRCAGTLSAQRCRPLGCCAASAGCPPTLPRLLPPVSSDRRRFWTTSKSERPRGRRPPRPRQRREPRPSRPRQAAALQRRPRPSWCRAA